jgi:hypothetical protein
MQAFSVAQQVLTISVVHQLLTILLANQGLTISVAHQVLTILLAHEVLTYYTLTAGIKMFIYISGPYKCIDHCTPPSLPQDHSVESTDIDTSKI